jgi:hypothetical protein
MGYKKPTITSAGSAARTACTVCKGAEAAQNGYELFAVKSSSGSNLNIAFGQYCAVPTRNNFREKRLSHPTKVPDSLWFAPFVF